MTDFAALIERLEKATEPHRNLDARIFIHLHPTWLDDGKVLGDETIPPYTASLDAALTLVADDQYVEVRRHSDGWYAYVCHHSSARDTTTNVGRQMSTPAHALCIAALRARSAP